MRKGVLCGVCMTLTGLILAGCSSVPVETRAYSLGEHPETAREVISQIATDQVRRNMDEWSKQAKGGSTPLLTPIPKEGMVVVRTTLEGHHQIEAALRELREQPANGH
jgi:hypothetical protein